MHQTCTSKQKKRKVEELEKKERKVLKKIVGQLK